MAPKKIALVTGASIGGLGFALCKALQQRGYRVFAGVRDRAKAGGLAREPDVELITLDVTDQDSLNQALATIQARTGDVLDVVINNAGSALVSPLLDTTPKQLHDLYDTNVFSVIGVTRTFLPLLMKSKGMVVNISSTGAYLGVPWFGAYRSTKSALTAISETLTVELQPFGIAVLTAIVGGVQTNLYKNGPPVSLPSDSVFTPALEQMRVFASGAGQEKGQVLPAQVAAELVNDIVAGQSVTVWRGGFAGTTRLLTSLPGDILGKAVRQNKGLELLGKP